MVSSQRRTPAATTGANIPEMAHKAISRRVMKRATRATLSQEQAMAPCPISRLPVELLSYIFILSTLTPDGTASDHERVDARLSTLADKRRISPCLTSSYTTPEMITSVCRHWQHVALTTPRLWSDICITPGDARDPEDGNQAVAFPFAQRRLARSGRVPLHIYIDGRDPDWDFSENDTSALMPSPFTDNAVDYTHPFPIEYMETALALVMPHAARFRSIVILTDRWAPMRTAVQCMSMDGRDAPKRLPHLESLVLMRCNEFISYHPEFEPPELKESPLPFAGLIRPAITQSRAAEKHAHGDEDEPVLPRLKHLILSGVHMDWSALPRLVPHSSSHYGGLRQLELSYHSMDVRPTGTEVSALFARSQNLDEIRIHASGPRTEAPAPLSLPHLRTLSLGYDNLELSAALLAGLDAPALENIELEDACSPDPDERADGHTILDALSPPAGAESRFPAVTRMRMTRVEASGESFDRLYAALPALRSLAAVHMMLLGSHGTLPSGVQLTFPPSYESAESGDDEEEAQGEEEEESTEEPEEPAEVEAGPSGGHLTQSEWMHLKKYEYAQAGIWNDVFEPAPSPHMLGPPSGLGYIGIDLTGLPSP